MHLMTSRLPFAEDLNVHENMGVRILKYIVQKCVGTGMTCMRLNCVFIYPKPAYIAQQKYTASKKYDPRCSSVVIALLPWLVPEGKVRWRGVQGPWYNIKS